MLTLVRMQLFGPATRPDTRLQLSQARHRPTRRRPPSHDNGPGDSEHHRGAVEANDEVTLDDIARLIERRQVQRRPPYPPRVSEVPTSNSTRVSG